MSSGGRSHEQLHKPKSRAYFRGGGCLLAALGGAWIKDLKAPAVFIGGGDAGFNQGAALASGLAHLPVSWGSRAFSVLPPCCGPTWRHTGTLPVPRTPQTPWWRW